MPPTMKELQPQKIRKFTISQKSAVPNKPTLLSRLRNLLRQNRKPSRNGARRSRLRQVMSYLPFIIAALVLAGVIGSIGLFAWIRKDLPNPNNILSRAVAQTTKIYDRTGKVVLYELHGNEKRTLVELKDISPLVLKATIVAEDRTFYEHSGFSVKGIARAILSNIRLGGRGQGGSTITQQLVKNALLTSEKTYTRKMKELLLSVEIERSFNKDEILKMYLNEIPYGSVVYGIESAAETFFDKKASELSLSESALLASLPQSTTHLSPYGSHTDELIARQHYILDAMVEEGYITAEEAQEAKDDNAWGHVKPRGEGILAPHFVFYVCEQLAEQLGDQVVERGGLKIITTLDAEKQKMAEEVIAEKRDGLKDWNASTAALMSFDPKTGDILAMVGSADYNDDEIDGKFNALLGLRQPGSSIKPVVYASAFSKGFTPDTVLYDVNTEFSGGPKPYAPKNYDFNEHGPVTMREALAGSLNIPAVKTLYLAGLDSTIRIAEGMGYTTFGDRDRFGLSLALGGAEVRPIEHISAFAAFANDGRIIATRSILKAEDQQGKTLIDNSRPLTFKKVLDEQVARQVTDIMSDNAARAYIFGENNYLTLGDRPVAAKSGTTNSYKDAWTLGFTPSLVTGVWVGNADGKEMKQGADGSRVAAPIWNAYMRRALQGTAVQGFTEPEQVTTGKPVLDGQKNALVPVKIDTVTGKLATEYTPPDMIEEKGFGVPHCILFFVDRNDPRGPMPTNPESDSMYELWEKGVADWAAKNGTVSNPPPTEYDDVHVPENVPNVEILRPQSGETIGSRDMFVDVNASSRRGVAKVEFSISGDKFATIDGEPFSGTVPIPNRFAKGFHNITVTAVDDVGNRASKDVTVNLTAGAGPIGVQWVEPRNSGNVYAYQFPYTIKFSIEDNRSVQSLEVTATSASSGSTEIIGNIENPPLPNMSMTWDGPVESGRYRLQIVAILKDSERRMEEILVNVY